MCMDTAYTKLYKDRLQGLIHMGRSVEQLWWTVSRLVCWENDDLVTNNTAVVVDMVALDVRYSQ